ncbi:Angiotensin-converting enzyme [Habropoda laboriosa]|uniref:Angiotensin-converting enzyme n=1 Tax=Habropoda laboriosa TaxID=597456 RepID=A0A0L7RGM3_9HYME|nr:PREDICTED: angiotensin-converting enzyme-like [Habropoda laboriosa]XP_017797035.1 PREDICTED: angiotensin-converting enzyme-like [Habropoda laboriosa]KOC69979.1 Angiotensin-converting enzyme [Habropoda laboriosa]
MQSKWAWIILNLVVCAIASVEDDNVKAFIQLTEYGYVDVCLDTTEAQWAFLNSPSNKTLSEWEEKLISYARFKILQMDEVANISKNDIHDSALLYKYDVAIKIGDALLHTDDLKKLVHFAGAAELQRLSRVRDTILKNHTRKDLENILSHSSNVENKSAVWTAWHQGLAPLVKNFSTILPLVSKAAKANGAKNVTEYWEFLSGYSEGYDKIKYEWSRLASLHKKILKFAINNLSQKYKITMNNTIPAYLLGSLQGSDWTPISVDVTPYPDLMYSIKKNLWKRRLIGKSLYKTASIMSSQILSQAPQAGFWGKSRFDQQCPSKLINFCQDAILSVSTCFEPTISNYLSAHKNVGKIVFNQISVEDTPVLNTANRYSGLEEGVSELFGILAASPAWLNYTHLMDNSTDSEQRLIVSLMITALNTLPQITYYMSADMWRIDAIEKGITNPEDLISSWWKHREEYEGLNSNGTNMPTFLDDDYITSNKPYLPKLTGTILAFQLYKYLMASTAVRYDSIVEKHININFLKMIQRGSADDWMKVLDKFLELDEVSFDSLLSFFSPLEDFIDELEENIQYKADTAKESELEELEKRVIVEMNTPSTTTTTTTTPRSVAGKTKTTSTSSSKQNDGRSGMNTVGNSNKNLESKSSILIPENSNILDVPTITEVPLDKSQLDSLDTDDDKKPKINTSKAVWAVGAVLLATIVICIIAIFGRQRCRKTPKNRRYV